MSSGTLTWICANGTEVTAAVPFGTTLMMAAVRNDVPGIIAECGGAASCATCHVELEAETNAKIDPPSVIEEDMLDFVAAGRREHSRLSCQLKMCAALDGARLVVPQS